MRVALIGSHGMLGQELAPRLLREGWEVVGLDAAAPAAAQLDITRSEAVHGRLHELNPALVINGAAYTAVDRAESEPEAAFAVNRDGVGYLAQACKNLHIPLIHLSTDYVFDGNRTRPYEEEDRADPINVYGLSKWQGEEALRATWPKHLIVRLSWMFGAHGHNFVKTILGLAREREELRVVADQVGCPSWAGHVAEALMRLSQKILVDRGEIQWGTYHFCGREETSWHGFAQAIVDVARHYEPLRVRKVIPIQSIEYPTPARRPRWSVLSCRKIDRIFQIKSPSWRQGLTDMLAELYSSEAAS